MRQHMKRGITPVSVCGSIFGVNRGLQRPKSLPSQFWLMPPGVIEVRCSGRAHLLPFIHSLKDLPDEQFAEDGLTDLYRL